MQQREVYLKNISNLTLFKERFLVVIQGLSLPPKSRLCIALSGGSDSMCLALLMKEVGSRAGYEISAVTVDHHLRPESTQEAKKVHSMMVEYGISHTTLDWPINQHSNHVTQEDARQARYSLLHQYCLDNQIPYLLTAHHLDDQAETLLMRFLKGSDVMGLAGIAPVSCDGEICLVRPLLQFSKEEILNFLQESNIPYVVDPSNEKDIYLRNRLRGFLQQEKIPPILFSGIAKKFTKIRSYFQFQIDQFIQENVTLSELGYISFPISAFKALHPLMAEKILSHLLMIMGKNQYPPRSKSVENAVSRMLLENQELSTLNGCEIRSYGNVYYISREKRNSLCQCFTEIELLFDDRFRLSVNEMPEKFSLKDLTVQYLSQEDVGVLKSSLTDSRLEKVPVFLRQKLIGVYSQKVLVSVPQICYFKDGWHFYIKFLRNFAQKHNMFTLV